MSPASKASVIGATRARRLLIAAVTAAVLIVAARALDAPALLGASLARIEASDCGDR